MKKEMVDIVDDDDKVIGKTDIDDVVAKKLLFRVARIIVVNSEGKVFVHQRQHSMAVFPGHYDFGAAGIVSSGESYLQAAARELAEELGVRNTAMKEIGRFRHERQTRTLNAVFLCTHDGPMTLQEEEIIHGRFMTQREIETLAKKEKMHPGGMTAYAMYLETLR